MAGIVKDTSTLFKLVCGYSDDFGAVGVVGVIGVGASEFASEVEAFSQWGCSQGAKYAVQMSIHVCAYLWGRQKFRHQV